MPHTIVVRFSEVTLKGRNRPLFERQMVRNVSRHLDGHGEFRLQRDSARLVVELNQPPHTAVEILRGLPGVANLSVAELVPREPEPLTEAVLAHAATRLEAAPPLEARSLPFRVEVSRKDKRYPLTSMELAASVHSDEAVARGAALYAEKIPGPGGLAVGSSGTVLCLLSGGIDSPVAAYLMMTRGAPVVFLNFHSFPFIGERSKEKVHELVRSLARYQPESRLCFAPFAKAQEAIRDRCPEGLRTVLYRRMMNRVANRLAGRVGALALVTGESLGQVASQTLENIRAIEDTAELPVLQPLIGMSKPEIIAVARRIGTYEISIQPFPDCCTLFQPRKPETRAKIERLARAESALPIEELVEECLAGIETSEYGPLYFPAEW